jgi:hypothetical protein
VLLLLLLVIAAAPEDAGSVVCKPVMQHMISYLNDVPLLTCHAACLWHVSSQHHTCSCVTCLQFQATTNTALLAYMYIELITRILSLQRVPCSVPVLAGTLAGSALGSSIISMYVNLMRGSLQCALLGCLCACRHVGQATTLGSSVHVCNLMLALFKVPRFFLCVLAGTSAGLPPWAATYM